MLKIVEQASCLLKTCFERRSLLILISCTNVNMGVLRGVGRVYLTCLQASKPLANPPLQVIDNGVISELISTISRTLLKSLNRINMIHHINAAPQ